MDPRISFAIPTFNRAPLLDKCLNALAQWMMPRTDKNRFEILISDNASTDETKEIILKWSSMMPHTVKCLLHSKRLDAHDNIYAAIKGCSGDFIKPINDKVVIREGAWDEVVACIDSEYKRQQRRPVVFTNSHAIEHKRKFDCTSIDSFIEKTSYLSTWIGSLGIWREFLDDPGDFNRHKETRLPQVDFLLRSIKKSGGCSIFNTHCMDVLLVRAGGYNVAKVFGSDYAYLLYRYRESGELQEETFFRELRNVFINHILPMYFDPEGNHDYDRDGLWENLGLISETIDVFALAKEYLMKQRKNGWGVSSRPRFGRS